MAGEFRVNFRESEWTSWLPYDVDAGERLGQRQKGKVDGLGVDYSFLQCDVNVDRAVAIVSPVRKLTFDCALCPQLLVKHEGNRKECYHVYDELVSLLLPRSYSEDINVKYRVKVFFLLPHTLIMQCHWLFDNTRIAMLVVP